ncbi:MAG: hypothetical protein HFJ79_09075 [Clostridiales bacterium]|nr:hypothetical protein [Clostridiales bacterium]
MELTNGSQFYNLFLSCGLGFLLGVYYDVFRVARLALRSGKRSIFFQDLFFFASSAVITFLFALAVTAGQLRLYIFLGSAAGFAAYYFTLGRVVMKFAGTAIRLILKVWHILWMVILFPFRWLYRLLRPLMIKLGHLTGKITEKPRSFLKKGLKHAGSLLYNPLKRWKRASIEEDEGPDA